MSFVIELAKKQLKARCRFNTWLWKHDTVFVQFLPGGKTIYLSPAVLWCDWSWEG